MTDTIRCQHIPNGSPRVAIVIVNWNGWKDTIECVDSLFQISYPLYHIVIVDNHSEDASLTHISNYCTGHPWKDTNECETKGASEPIKVFEYSRKEIEREEGLDSGDIWDIPPRKRITLIKNDYNAGSTGGHNLGVLYALKTLYSKYILILNNDTLVNDNFLTELVKVAETNETIGLVQPKILNYRDPTINTTGQLCDITAKSYGRGRFEPDTGQYDHLTDSGFFYGSGACLLIRKSLILEMDGNLFDSELFLYHEDIDLAWTARLLNYRILYAPKSIIIHKEGRSSKRINPRTTYWATRNRLRVLIKNYSLLYLVWILPLSAGMSLFSAVLSTVYWRDIGFIHSYLKSLVWNAQHIKGTLKLRHTIQSKRRISDRQLVEAMENGLLDLKELSHELRNRMSHS